ncbi:MAG: hypothetical protein JWO78_2466 [Micavibrio sp.]|nr:hypothetical protein [Micavibrio sp.]
MKNLGQHIELINTARNPEEAFENFRQIMEGHGYERIAYSLVTDHPSLGLPRQHGLATSYPDDWMKFYKEKNYAELDPVTQTVLSSRKPFFWSDVVDDPGIAQSSLRLMREAEDSGVTDGISISLCGQGNELVGIGLARKSALKENHYSVLSGAYLLSVYFHETYRAMLSKPLKIKLTARETEILSWAAEGKTDDDIAAILNISQNTVRFHWKKVFTKLEAHGRIYAITKAIRLNLITPAFVGNPYQKR